MHQYVPKGVCAKQISFSIEDGLLHDVRFAGGCPGNLEGISRLLEGMPVEAVIEKFSGITCGNKPTSCPDQLAKILAQVEAGEHAHPPGAARLVWPAPPRPLASSCPLGRDRRDIRGPAL